ESGQQPGVLRHIRHTFRFPGEEGSIGFPCSFEKQDTGTERSKMCVSSRAPKNNARPPRGVLACPLLGTALERLPYWHTPHRRLAADLRPFSRTDPLHSQRIH